MKLKTPVIIINFKAFASATGKNALKLARICQDVAKKEKASIAIAVQAADIYHITKSVSIPVFSQRIDDMDPGSHTGSILAEDVKSNGAVGTLLNHSEHRLNKKTLNSCMKRTKKNRLLTIVCSPNAATARLLKKNNPDFIAVEPPELIGGKISVSTSRPYVISKSVHLLCGKNAKKCRKLIVGAGVHTADDVSIALKLGAAGVL